MRILCLVKVVPDVDKFKYDFNTNTVIRENVRMILNPDDSSAVGFALKAKSTTLNTFVEVVTMGPKSTLPLLRDLIRVGVDKVTLLSDQAFAASDSYATSNILASYIKMTSYDLILTGTHAIDGDTSHVPAQVSDLLKLPQMSNIIKIESLDMTVVFDVDGETSTCTYEMSLPGVLSIQKESKYKLPYIKYADIDRDVDDSITIVTKDDLNLNFTLMGLKGSLTKVSRTFVKEYEKRDKMVVKVDEEGINIVYHYLKEKGYV